MNNDKLREAADGIAGILQHFCLLRIDVDIEYVKQVILAELVPVFPAPAPVDDKTLTEAIQDLKATQQEAAKLRKALEQIYSVGSHWSCILIAREALARKARAAGEGKGAT